MSIQDDGFSTTIAFSLDSSISMEEVEVTPPGISGGGEINKTTMQNTTYRTKSPKSLIDLSPCSLVVAYDPEVYDDIISMVNTNQQITVTFPDSSTLVFWGWIDEFTPNANVEGERPTAEINIIPSNENNSAVETAPIYSA